eukprot:TRINITY_DN1215_c0_g1_i1.p2 TRINITY_DN1215_c0_g1~~TRINITY_DN1215_c0_g1_i1.p2  ORF type:complete len:51 (-),score=8.44 TRINITY_DN1215_c0_g1_i1:61-213(-)
MEEAKQNQLRDQIEGSNWLSCGVYPLTKQENYSCEVQEQEQRVFLPRFCA